MKQKETVYNEEHFAQNNRRTSAVHMHADPPPIPLIKIKNDVKSEKDYVQIKFCSDPTSEKSDLYKFKMALFDNGSME